MRQQTKRSFLFDVNCILDFDNIYTRAKSFDRIVFVSNEKISLKKWAFWADLDQVYI